MIKPFEKMLLCFSLLLILTGYSIDLHAQQQGDSLAVALTKARNAGISETKLNQLLALGYEKQFEPSAMASLLSIVAQCQQENLPVQPFLSKIEEGISKRAPAPRIEQVLMSKQEDYRFTRSLIDETMKRQGRDETYSHTDETGGFLAAELSSLVEFTSPIAFSGIRDGASLEMTASDLIISAVVSNGPAKKKGSPPPRLIVIEGRKLTDGSMFKGTLVKQ